MEEKEVPVVEIGGEVNECLKAELVKEVGIVDGKSVVCGNPTPFGSLLLQTLHFFRFNNSYSRKAAVMWIREKHAVAMLRYLY